MKSNEELELIGRDIGALAVHLARWQWSTRDLPDYCDGRIAERLAEGRGGEEIIDELSHEYGGSILAAHALGQLNAERIQVALMHAAAGNHFAAWILLVRSRRSLGGA